MKFDIISKDEVIPVGSYELDEMPGCCRVGISHALQIYPFFRGKGYGTQGMIERLQNAEKAGFEILIATVVAGNIPEEKILEKFKWRPVTIFNNSKGHVINLWIKNLKD